MRLTDILSVSSAVSSREELDRYGRTPLGVLAEQEGVFCTKDSYARRERLVREWATENFGADYTEGLYRAVNGLRMTRETKSFVSGYNHGKKFISRLS